MTVCRYFDEGWSFGIAGASTDAAKALAGWGKAKQDSQDA